MAVIALALTLPWSDTGGSFAAFIVLGIVGGFLSAMSTGILYDNGLADEGERLTGTDWALSSFLGSFLR
jgi:hypothetical protein